MIVFLVGFVFGAVACLTGVSYLLVRMLGHRLPPRPHPRNMEQLARERALARLERVDGALQPFGVRVPAGGTEQ